MKLKSLFNKFIPGKKKSPEITATEDKTEIIQQNISFERRETRIEEPGTVGEIDVYVNDEKINIYSLKTITKIGRDPSQADISISELIVSKLHCTIFSRDDHYIVQDNNSTNGIYVNHQKVTEHEIKDGDTILLGKKGTVKLVFHLRR